MGEGNLTQQGRLFFDISFTRTQTGSVGITRTVRRLREEFDRVLPDGERCIAVAFNSQGFREVATETTFNALATGVSTPQSSAAARLLRWVTESFARRLAFALLPLPLLYQAWRLHSLWTFNVLSTELRKVAFRPGDRLVMCDAAWSYEAWVAASAARKNGAQVVLMIHDLIPIQHPEYCAPLFTLVFRKWLTAMLTCTDAVICNSKSTQKDLKDFVQSAGLDLPPTGHFRLGSDPATETASKEVRPAIKEFFNCAAPCFAAIGTFEPRKNYALLLDVFQQIWAAGHDIRLLIAGRPNPDCHALIQIMKNHSEQGQRLLTIFDASDEEITHIYSRCRMLVFPSLAEGFGLPLVEARTRGCLVIASDLSSFQELADEGVFLFDRTSAKALEKIILQHARSTSNFAIQPMHPFLWHDSAKQFLETVDGLLV